MKTLCKAFLPAFLVGHFIACSDSPPPTIENPNTTNCQGGDVHCGDQCVDLLTAPAHCGSCNNSCVAQCSSGRCVEQDGDCRKNIACEIQTYCDLLDGKCKPGCATDGDCGTEGNCIIATHTCCTAPDQLCGSTCCTKGTYCDSADQVCRSGCVNDADCAGFGPCNTDTHRCCSADQNVCDGKCVGSEGIRCAGNDSITACDASGWSTMNCQQVCTTDGYDQSYGCVEAQAVPGDRCSCGSISNYAEACGTGYVCADELVCVDLGTVGFCTKFCETNADCPAAGFGTIPECGNLLAGDHKICSFTCTFLIPCPTGMTCDLFKSQCTPA
jgi:hypothetical protein